MARIKDPLTGEEKEKGVTAFTPPAEDVKEEIPLVSAASYTKRVEAKRKALADAKRNRQPLGGAPPIPEGKLQPLADAARMSSMPQPDWGLPPVPPPPDDSPNANGDVFFPPKASPVQGVGSAYPVNQAMAQGEVNRPMNLRESRELARQKREELEAMAEAQAQAEKEVEEQAEENLPAPKERLDDAERELVERGALDFFDPEAFQRAQIPLLSPERKKTIEERLSDLDFEDLITKREIQQDIPIIPGKFNLGLRTVREKEHLWILQYLYEKTGVSSPAHVDELNSVCRLTCAVRSINGKPLPDHRENVGQPDESINREKFEKKLEIILGFPTQLVADFGVQFNWFSDRVAALFSLEELKNG